jgi:hypothetical protein
MSTPLPGAKDLVTLRLTSEDLSHAVEVKCVEDGYLVISAPKVDDGIVRSLEETLFELEWSSVRGLLTAPVRWIGYHDEQVWLWQVELCGPITALQRRRFVRAPLSTPGRMHVGAADRAGAPDLNTATALDSTLLDLSEAGVRMVLPRGARHAEALTSGQRVVVELALQGELLLLPGEVLHALPVVPPGGEALCVVVVLADAGSVSAMLRKAVLQAQIDARKAWV